MKFKVGDKVLVTKINKTYFEALGEYQGRIGVVTYICPDETNPWPYSVTFTEESNTFGDDELIIVTETSKILFGDKNE